MQILFTDAERAFSDSAEGKSAIALARRDHQTSEAHKGALAKPWTDSLEADAVRRLSTAAARQAVQCGASIRAMADTAATMGAETEATRAAREYVLRNGWRQGAGR